MENQGNLKLFSTAKLGNLKICQKSGKIREFQFSLKKIPSIKNPQTTMFGEYKSNDN